MKPIHIIIIEAIVVGLSLIPFVYVTGMVAKLVTKKPALPEICEKWNKYYIMEVNLFLAGFLFHIVFELLGINKWYAKNYFAY